MIISLINHTNGKLTDEEVQNTISDVNRPMEEDYELYWSLGATLRLEGKAGAKPKQQEPSDMRGDAVLYLWDNVNVANALGYHERNNRGIPFGFVFTELSKSLGESWTVTLSHEALELIGDPEVNLLVAGPHPANPKQDVFHWYEMCDAVQVEPYQIEGAGQLNLLLPPYFPGLPALGRRTDSLGRPHDGTTLESVG